MTFLTLRRTCDMFASGCWLLLEMHTVHVIIDAFNWCATWCWQRVGYMKLVLGSMRAHVESSSRVQSWAERAGYTLGLRNSRT